MQMLDELPDVAEVTEEPFLGRDRTPHDVLGASSWTLGFPWG